MDIKISFDCSVENAEKLIGIASEEIDSVKQNGIRLEIYNNSFKIQSQLLKEELHDDSFWFNYLVTQLKYHRDIYEIKSWQEQINKITYSTFNAVLAKQLS